MADDETPRCEFDASDVLLRLNFSGPARLETIDPVVQWVISAVKDMDCAKGKEWEIETALREALSNAMIHGCKNDATKTVEFSVACDAARSLLIVVRDPGEGFDFAKLPDPCAGTNIYSDHGRGVYLINRLMDEVHFERGGAEIHMRKR